MHVLRFMEFVGQLDPVDSLMSHTDKIAKMMRSILLFFSGVCMANPLHKTELNELFDAMQAEIARRNNPNNPHMPDGSARKTSSVAATAKMAETLIVKKRASVNAEDTEEVEI